CRRRRAPRGRAGSACSRAGGEGPRGWPASGGWRFGSTWPFVLVCVPCACAAASWRSSCGEGGSQSLRDDPSGAQALGRGGVRAAIARDVAAGEDGGARGLEPVVDGGREAAAGVVENDARAVLARQ